MSVVVAHQVSATAAQALREAGREASFRGVRLDVIHVVDSLDNDIAEVERLLAHRATRLTHPCDRKTLWAASSASGRLARMVDRIVLESAGVVLEPLELAHVDGLVAAATEDRSTYAFTWVPHDVDTMTSYVETALAEQERSA